MLSGVDCGRNIYQNERGQNEQTINEFQNFWHN
jgi:hypothetical protein